MKKSFAGFFAAAMLVVMLLGGIQIFSPAEVSAKAECNTYTGCGDWQLHADLCGLPGGDPSCRPGAYTYWTTHCGPELPCYASNID